MNPKDDNELLDIAWGVKYSHLFLKKAKMPSVKLLLKRLFKQLSRVSSKKKKKVRKIRLWKSSEHKIHMFKFFNFSFS